MPPILHQSQSREQHAPAWWPVAGVLSVMTLAEIAIACDLTPTWWGIDQSRYLGVWYCWILVTLCVLYWSPLRTSAGRLLLGSNEAAGHYRYWPAAVSLLIGVAAFWYLCTATHFLGDGYFWARNITQAGWHPSGNEPLDSLLHRAVWAVGHHLFGWDGVNAYRCLSILAGCLYLGLVVVLKEYAGRTAQEKRFLWWLLLSVGMLQVFCGYVESYAILAVCVTAYVTILFSRMQYRLYWAAGIAGFAAITHLSGIVLLPSLLYILYQEVKDRPRTVMVMQTLWATAAGLTPVLATLAVMALCGWSVKDTLFGDSPARLWLPLTEPLNGAAYTMFSLSHAFDVFNELLLIAPVTVFLLPVLWNRKGGTWWNGHHERNATLILALSYVGFLWAFNLKLGAGRDWDIFSPLAVPVTVWGALLISRCYGKRLVMIAPAIVLYAVVQTSGFLLVNADETRSVARIRHLAQHSGWSGYARGDIYDALRSWHYGRGEKDEALRYAALAAESVPNTRYYSNYAALLAELRRMEPAKEVLEQILVLEPLHFEANLNLGALCAETGDLERAAECYARALEVDSTVPNLHYNIGVLHLYRHDQRTARQFFHIALRLNPHYDQATQMLTLLEQHSSIAANLQ